MKEINQNILEIKKGIIVHQVNCLKQMGAGLAKDIKTKFPKVYYEYSSVDWYLGDIQVVRVSEDWSLFVCNLAGQHSFGRARHRYTDYNAVRRGFKKLAEWKIMFSPKMEVYVPYKMGCSLGNGNWNIYSKIIEEECPEAIICKWGR